MGTGVRIGVIALLTAGSIVMSSAAQASTASQRTLATPVASQAPQASNVTSVFGWGLAAPGAFASDGTHLWIATNSDLAMGGWQADALVELSAKTGAFERVVRDVPSVSVLLASGTHLWAISNASKIYELSPATGAIQRIISNGRWGYLTAIATNGVDLWVSDASNGLTELRASNGVFVRQVVLPGRYRTNPAAMVIAGGELWVLNNAGLTSSVVVLSASTGARVRVLEGAAFGFAYPMSMATNGTDVWVVNASYGPDNTVTEISVKTGTLVKVLARGYGFDNSVQVALDGPYVLVVNRGTFVGDDGATKGSNGSVSVLWASDHTLVRRIGLPSSNDGGGPSEVVTAGGHVWVADAVAAAPGIRQLDIATGSIERRILGSNYGFFYPGPIASNGTDVWVGSSSSVTEMSASDGSLVRILSGPAYGFSVESITADSSHLWVLNSTGSITELSASTGAVVQTISGAPFDLHGAARIISDGTHVWVSNPCGPQCAVGSPGKGSITELSASTGTLVQVLSGPSFQLDQPGPISSDGVHVWIADFGGNSVSELDAATGAFVRSISVSEPSAIASDGADVWVTSLEAGVQGYNGAGVTEISASTGTVVRAITSGIGIPVAIASDGTGVWVANCECQFIGNDYGGVTELSASTGDVVGPAGATDGINGPSGIALGGGRAWVTNRYGDSVTAFPTS
jgi:hypothetical protein